MHCGANVSELYCVFVLHKQHGSCACTACLLCICAMSNDENLIQIYVSAVLVEHLTLHISLSSFR